MSLNLKKNNPIKVLIVDDSAFMRKVLSDMLNSDKSISVVGTAVDGRDALEKIHHLYPDVVTLDVDMPVMDGINCLKQIMQKIPKPVIMFGSETEYGTEMTIRALDEGAVDFVVKPKNIFDIKNESKRNEIIEKITIAKNIRLKSIQKKMIDNDKRVTARSKKPVENIIAIGSSTGGPKALQTVIPYLPRDMSIAVLVVQHMPPGFTKSLAERLDSKSDLIVKEATHREKVLEGYAYIAPGDSHMKVQSSANGDIIIHLDKSPPVGGHRPSVDVMMTSLSETGFENIIGVILTGMGADGSAGIKKLKEVNKSFIIAQDEETSVVYGMPKMAVQTGAVDKIVSLDKIPGEIIQYLGVR
ncbi:protein-glutamate methylesterase/protein-glutamine glutaminase [Ruminiclostridium cellulolyticum]|uniref:Protein-glutamate methylesterase/protein-glutamine glutaminase n=1 Tax=Ruminiclostridium cellulolyticum (strain ATCC 35319 / DSM 5812 / JCM 6584 / H10) TaxID=394503 RepID=B8I3N1_RUMCH|nr:chemotaxis response regulator protein-glutamate methylesterase [Ruminiclostridium cellulolyticum]ACL76374.1 response regulator receiver modulated CheB methylesterase [Ruminiclostridium cellulolyticum H10]